jgi:multidrug resistance efflux pump
MKNKQNNLPVIVAVILVLAVAVVWFMVQHFHKSAQAETTSMYDTIEAKRMDLSEKVDATGDVTTEKNAALYSPYSATVKQLLAKPGQAVHTGDSLLLLQIKDADVINYAAGYKSSLEQAKSNLIAAQNALVRQQTLYKIQGTTIDELESAQKSVQQYQAQVSEYTLKLESLTKNGVNDNNEIVIKAPFDAEVSWINVKEAEAVSTTDELLTLGGASAIRVEAAVDQGDISQIKAGQRAFITANDENRTIIPGVVTSFGSTGTTSSNVVTFPVDIKPLSVDTGLNQTDKNNNPNAKNARKFGNKEFPGNPEKKSGQGNGFRNNPTATGNKPAQDNNLKKMLNASNVGNLLKSGMTVDVTIMVNPHKGVLAVPLRAITQVNGENIVKVIKQGKLVPTKVSLGFQSDRYVEILSGLAEGDQVAIPKTQFNNANNNSNNRGSGVRSPNIGGPGMGGPHM